MSTEAEPKKEIIIPIYLVADVSGSMDGEPLDELNKFLPECAAELRKAPTVADKIRIGLIAFSDSAEEELPLCDLTELATFPQLKAIAGTQFGKCFQLLANIIPSDVNQLRADGYWVKRPIVFFLTDGVPSDRDQWQSDYDSLIAIQNFPTIVPIGIGKGVGADGLRILNQIRHRKDGPVTAPVLHGEDAVKSLNDLIPLLTRSFVAGGVNAGKVDETTQILDTLEKSLPEGIQVSRGYSDM